jgi:hypothetical protein
MSAASADDFVFDFSAPLSSEDARAAIQAIGAVLRLSEPTASCDQYDAWVRDTFGPEYVAP